MADYNTKLRAKLIAIFGFLGLLALNAWIFFVVGHGSWQEKIEIPLQILTVYALAFGFLSTSDILKDFGNITESMTNPNLYKFMSGNFLFLGSLFFIWKTALEPRKTRYSSFYLLELLLLLVGTFIIFAYTAFHIIVIMPISYIAYVIVSVPIRAIQTSADDLAISDGTQTITVNGYMFSWEKVPGNESYRLINFLKAVFHINWVENAQIIKTDEDRTIRIFTEEKSVEIMLYENNDKAILKISDGQTDKLQVTEENGVHSIYYKGIFSPENNVAMRNFLIGIPAMILQVVIPMLLSIASNIGLQ